MPLALSFQKTALCALPRLPAWAIRLMAGSPIRRDGGRLDPRVQLLTRLAPAKGNVGTDDRTIARERAEIERLGAWLWPHPRVPVTVEDITLPGAAEARDARIYRPDGLPTPAPALLYFHGGGHIIGSILSHDALCRTLAHHAGITVISYDYRLAPEHPFPAGIEDCIAAFRALGRQAEDLGIDAGRIAIGGDSAGANCAAVVAQTCRADTRPPACQLLYVPWVEMGEKHPSYCKFATGFLLEEVRMDWFTRLYLDGAEPDDPRISPLRGDLSGLCPALIWTAGFDPLRDEGEAYAAALERAGTPVRHERLEGMPHGFAMLAGAVPAARAAVEHSAKLLGDTLRRKEPA